MDTLSVPVDGEHLRQAAATLDITLDNTQIAQLLEFRDRLLIANASTNLTAITGPEAVLSRHIIDSLTCTLACRDVAWEEPRVLDVGSGGGFPALVLAIAFPRWQILSLEATAKKVRFQEEVITALGLANARVVHGRAEVLAHDAGWRGHFHLVTARALAALPTLLEWCQPLAMPGGRVIALKKGELAQELAEGAVAAALLNGGPPIITQLPPTLVALMPDLADGRVVIQVAQLGPPPPRYPRSGALPVKSPLGRALKADK